MFRLLAYPRVKLRSDSGPVTPICPVECVRTNIIAMMEGVKLSFRCPIHYPYHSSNERLQPKRDMVQDFHGHVFHSDLGGAEPQRYWPVFKRSWAFNGKWFSGARGQLKIFVAVYESSLEDSSLSLFNPKVFKFEMGEFLERYLDATKNQPEIVWAAPINWAMKVDARGVAASFEAIPNAQRTPKLFHVAPISDRKYVSFVFDFIQFAPGDQKRRDAIVDIRNMRNMADRVIDSIKIELNDSSKAQLARVIESVDSYELDSNFPPIKWEAESKTPLTLPI